MKIFIVYCHPSKDSFTHKVLQSFIDGIKEKHEYQISDLYEMNFKTDIDEKEYLRESNYRYNEIANKDVIDEQNKIQWADILIFIYPVFWTDCPAKLKGWFDRVWNAGFAYGDIRNMKKIEKVYFLATAGKTIEALEDTKEKEAMEIVMLNDRIRDRAKEKFLIILDGVTKYDMNQRNKKEELHLKAVYNLAKSL